MRGGKVHVGTPTKGGVSFVTFIHIVSLLGQFKFEWPEGLKAFFGWFSVFKLNVAVARLECTTALILHGEFGIRELTQRARYANNSRIYFADGRKSDEFV